MVTSFLRGVRGGRGPKVARREVGVNEGVGVKPTQFSYLARQNMRIE